MSNPPTDPVFEADTAGFSVRDRTLVEHASLSLGQGRLTIVIGPNGAGKSTLLKLMTGELAPATGSIRSFGEPLSRAAPWRLAARRAVMAQASRLSFPFAVHDVVRLGAEGIGRAQGRAALDANIETALGEADVLALAGRDYQTLSGGEQQRVQFARVLCQLEAGRSIEPMQALFLDEPIASLDLCHQLALLDAVRSLTRRESQPVAALAILHDLNLAATYADHLVVMHHGRIVAAGPPSEVLTEALLETVFNVRLSMRAPPPSRLPYVLPQLRMGAAS